MTLPTLVCGDRLQSPSAGERVLAVLNTTDLSHTGGLQGGNIGRWYCLHGAGYMRVRVIRVCGVYARKYGNQFHALVMSAVDYCSTLLAGAPKFLTVYADCCSSWCQYHAEV